MPTFNHEQRIDTKKNPALIDPAPIATVAPGLHSARLSSRTSVLHFAQIAQIGAGLIGVAIGSGGAISVGVQS